MVVAEDGGDGGDDEDGGDEYRDEVWRALRAARRAFEEALKEDGDDPAFLKLRLTVVFLDRDFGPTGERIVWEV